MINAAYHRWTDSGLICDELEQDCLRCPMRIYNYSAKSEDILKGFRYCKQFKANEQLRQKGIQKPAYSTLKASNPKPRFTYKCEGCNKTVSVQRDHGGRACRKCAQSKKPQQLPGLNGFLG